MEYFPSSKAIFGILSTSGDWLRRVRPFLVRLSGSPVRSLTYRFFVEDKQTAPLLCMSQVHYLYHQWNDYSSTVTPQPFGHLQSALTLLLGISHRQPKLQRLLKDRNNDVSTTVTPYFYFLAVVIPLIFECILTLKFSSTIAFDTKQGTSPFWLLPASLIDLYLLSGFKPSGNNSLKPLTCALAQFERSATIVMFGYTTDSPKSLRRWVSLNRCTFYNISVPRSSSNSW